MSAWFYSILMFVFLLVLIPRHTLMAKFMFTLWLSMGRIVHPSVSPSFSFDNLCINGRIKFKVCIRLSIKYVSDC